MHLGNIGAGAVGQQSAVDGAAADNEGIPPLGQRCRRFGGAAEGEAGNFIRASGQSHVHPAGQRLPVREIVDGAPPHDHHGPLGGLAEEFTVGGQGDGLGAIPADAPVVIYSCNQIHTASLISPWGSRTGIHDIGSFPFGRNPW